MKRIALFWLIIGGIAIAQNPQSSAPLFAANAKYVNGIAPGYYPSAGTGLSVILGPGTVNCSGTIIPYGGSGGGGLSLTASTTNYVYLNTSASCAPAVKTTTFTSSDIPIAAVVTSGSAVTSITDDRTMFNVPGSGGSGGGVSYLPVGSTVVIAGSSIFGDDSHVTSPAQTAAAWSCGSGICTVNTTTAHLLNAGDFVDIHLLAGWPAAPTGLSNIYDTGYATFQVLSAGLTSTAFEVSYSGSSTSGSGGSIYNADFYGAFAAQKEPFFQNASLVYRFGSCADELTYFTQKFGSLSGSPKILVFAGCQDDILGNTSVIGIKSTLQQLWQTARAAGWTVIQISQLGTNYGLGACVGSNNCGYITEQLNSWLPAQGRSYTTTTGLGCSSTCGEYWDGYIDLATFESLPYPMVGNDVGGGKLFAKAMNQAFAQGQNHLNGPSSMLTWDQSGGGNGSVRSDQSGWTWYSAGSPTFTISGWTNQVLAGNGASFYFKSFTGNATSCLYVDTAGLVHATGSACGGSSGLSGMTSGQVAIAGSPSTITSSIPLAGAGAGVTTGPTSGTTAGNIATEQGTTGQIQDSGIAVSSLAPKASPTFTGTITTPISGGGTQCVHANNSGQLSGIGFDCGSGSGGTSVQINGGSGLSTLNVTGNSTQSCADVSGSGTAQSCSTSTSFTPFTNACVVYTTTTPNSGAGLTLNINSFGAKNAAIPSGSGWTTTLTAGAVPSGTPLTACYTGTNWNLSGTGIQAASGATHGVSLPLSPNGTPASPSGLYQTAPYSYTISACVFTTTTADPSTALVFNVKFNGTSILSGSSATISAATSPGTVTSLTLGSSLTVTAGENFELDVTAGTSTWTGVISCHS